MCMYIHPSPGILRFARKRLDRVSRYGYYRIVIIGLLNALIMPQRDAHDITRCSFHYSKEFLMKNSFWLFIAGCFSLLGGMFALAHPFAASLTAEQIAGWSFIVVGVVAMVSAFRTPQGFSLGTFLLGLLALLLGLHLVFNPLHGMISLTAATAVLLLVAGSWRIVMAFSLRGYSRMALLFSGVISLILSVMIFSNFPQSAAVVLGMFLGIELLSNGVSLTALSLAGKRAAA